MNRVLGVGNRPTRVVGVPPTMGRLVVLMWGSATAAGCLPQPGTTQQGGDPTGSRMVRRTTVVSRGPELRLTPNLVYSGVELQPVLESMSRGSEYADETYNRIHEVGYNLNGNANNKGSWSFHQLNPKCDVRVHYNSYVQADVTGLSSAVMITPYQRNTGGTTLRYVRKVRH